MATLIGDVYGADSSPFHSRAPTSGAAITAHQHHQTQQFSQHPQHHHPQQPPSPSQSQERPMPVPANTNTPTTITGQAHYPASPPLSSSNSFSSPPGQVAASGIAAGIVGSAAAIVGQNPALRKDKIVNVTSPASGEGRIPTPPDSSSPSSPQQTRDGCAVQPMASNSDTSTSSTLPSSSSSLPGLPASYVLPVPPIPQPAPEQRPQRTILIRDLNHIQSLTQADSALSSGGVDLSGAGLGLGLGGAAPLQDVKFEISAMPIGDIIEMVAALLTKITTTNDHQHDALHRNASQQRQAQAHNEGDGSSNGHTGGGHASPFSASVLAFHGKNVPAITILSYLSRIHKYCPTTYEVFLSLLVYFDRMTERVNDLVMKQQQEQEKLREQQQNEKETKTDDKDVVMRDDDGSSDVDETDEGLADSDDSSSSSEDEDDEGGAPRGNNASSAAATAPTAPSTAAAASTRATPAPAPDAAGPLSAATYFVVDSYNIHRLIIAGVTCASKFFSDVFYTNARYAKVGGLPLAELNHLELQFLILNDFRLAIPIEDLEAYATMLVEFYAREVVGTRPRPSSSASASTAAP